MRTKNTKSRLTVLSFILFFLNVKEATLYCSKRVGDLDPGGIAKSHEVTLMLLYLHKLTIAILELFYFLSSPEEISILYMFPWFIFQY